MSKALRNSLIVLVLIVGSAALVLTGFYFGRMWSSPMGYWPGWAAGYSFNDDARSIPYGMGPGMMGSLNSRGFGYMGPGMMGQGMMGSYGPTGSFGYMGPGMMGPGMMGSFGPTGSFGYMGPGMMGPGMMGSYGPTGSFGYMGSGMMGQGMMGSYGFGAAADFEPLSLEEAEAAVAAWLAGLGAADLALGEIMIFDNHAYAQILEADTGIGAMELLVDPVTRAVSPEHGPNMMWNLKYSPMAGTGMMGMMSGFRFGDFDDMMGGQSTSESEIAPSELPISPEKAVETAQVYLDVYLPGTTTDDEADPFYGYYTIHINENGDTVGMLSVNGYTGDVFVHTWHGEFIEMSDEH